MKFIKSLGTEQSGAWIRHFALYECHRCGSEFKADVNDVKRGRKKNCGCAFELKSLPDQLNGLKVITDFGVINGRRTALFQCPMCENNFNAVVSEVKGGRGKMNCGNHRIKKEKPVQVPKVKK